MSPTSGDLLLVNRGGVNYQIDYDDMSTLQDTDLLLVNRAGVNYQIAASDLDLGPDGLILPSVDVLTPVNGAGLNEGASYTPMSSAYVSTDSTPVYYRWWDNAMTVISGGSVSDQNNLFDGNTSTSALVGNSAAAVSQAVYNNLPSGALAGGREGETTVYAYAAGGGTIEVLDDDGTTVLRSYALPTSNTITAIGIVRANDKIRFTTASVNTGLYLSHISIADGDHQDFVITGRVAFEFTDNTDLDKMVAPIIQTDENGNVKVPTTSTVDSTTTIPGVNKSLYTQWTGGTNTVSIQANDGSSSGFAPKGSRMSWFKTDDTAVGGITDNVAIGSKWFMTDSTAVAQAPGPVLSPTESTYTSNAHWNKSGVYNFVAEIGVAPKVLDIVTWTGDGALLREIPHNLGAKVGMVIVKGVDIDTSFGVWHKELDLNNVLFLNQSQGQGGAAYFPFNPTQDTLYVGNAREVNQSGSNYVAYVFAADTAGKVKCGTYTGNGGLNVVETGFRSGFVLTKDRYNANSWCLCTEQTSAMRRFWETNGSGALQGNWDSYMDLSYGSQAFRIHGSDSRMNTNTARYVYLAISDDLTGPNSTQLNLLSGQDLEYFTTGTSITSNLAASGNNISFGSEIWAGTGASYRNLAPAVPQDGTNAYFFNTSEQVNDKWWLWIKSYNTYNGHNLYDSERGFNSYLKTSNPNPAYMDSDNMLMGPAVGNPGYRLGNSGFTNENASSYISWNFKAAPQFFDIQKYAGGSQNYAANGGVAHDLGVEPGMIIIKDIAEPNDWWVWHADMGAGRQLALNSEGSAVNTGPWLVEATDTMFAFNSLGGSFNSSSRAYMSYIFAKDTPYVKCGTYTGAGSNTVVDVGFKPRWMMIKKLLGTGNWVILDRRLSGTYLSANADRSMDSLAYTFTDNGVTLVDNDSYVNSTTAYIYVAIAEETEGHPPFAPSSTTVTETPDPATATMVVNAESFDVGDSASGPALEASITSVAGTEGNSLLVDASTGTWLPGLYAKGSETTVSAPSADEITFTSQNQGTTPFSGVDATLTSRTWTLESGTTATGPWTVVDTYVDYDALASQDGATPWSSNKPALTADTFYRVKVSYDSNNAESVESVYSTFKTSA